MTAKIVFYFEILNYLYGKTTLYRTLPSTGCTSLAYFTKIQNGKAVSYVDVALFIPHNRDLLNRYGDTL
jgi:hypothetical protein